MFERESRREKIIEGKMREQRLRLRAKQQLEVAQWQKEQAPPSAPAPDHIKITTAEFFEAVAKVFPLPFNLSFFLTLTQKRMKSI